MSKYPTIGALPATDGWIMTWDWGRRPAQIRYYNEKGVCKTEASTYQDEVYAERQRKAFLKEHGDPQKGNEND